MAIKAFFPLYLSTKSYIQMSLAYRHLSWFNQPCCFPHSFIPMVISKNCLCMICVSLHYKNNVSELFKNAEDNPKWCVQDKKFSFFFSFGHCAAHRKERKFIVSNLMT